MWSGLHARRTCSCWVGPHSLRRVLLTLTTLGRATTSTRPSPVTIPLPRFRRRALVAALVLRRLADVGIRGTDIQRAFLLFFFESDQS